MLNLDDFSEEEMPIEEDTDTDCILCKYTNHDYLDHLYYTLCGSTSKNNMYTTLFDAFDKRMKELDRHGFESHKLKKDELINHYENHLISIERTAMEDIRLCKKMMKSLERKIVTREPMNYPKSFIAEYENRGNNQEEEVVHMEDYGFDLSEFEPPAKRIRADI